MLVVWVGSQKWQERTSQKREGKVSGVDNVDRHTHFRAFCLPLQARRQFTFCLCQSHSHSVPCGSHDRQRPLCHSFQETLQILGDINIGQRLQDCYYQDKVALMSILTEKVISTQQCMKLLVELFVYVVYKAFVTKLYSFAASCPENSLKLPQKELRELHSWYLKMRYKIFNNVT